MQKKIIALAVAGLVSGVAFAQSNVTVYGIADVGVEYGKYGSPAGGAFRVQSGQQSASRIGFKGEEALGNGLKAVFALEAGVGFDNGNITHSGSTNTATNTGLFGREAWAGLSSATLGTVTLGRQYSTMYHTIKAGDAFNYGLGGSLLNSLVKVPGYTSRVDNSIVYKSPTFSGFTLVGAYSSGSNSGAETPTTMTAANDSAGSVWAAMGSYSNGPIAAALAYHDVTGTANNIESKAWAGSASYDFKVVKLFGAYSQGKTTTGGVETAKANGWSLGVKAPFGAHAVTAQYASLNNKTAADNDFKTASIGYEYSLSKRTNLYAAYTKGTNKNAATYGLDGSGTSSTQSGSSVAGYDPYNIMTGVRHYF